MGAWRAYPCGVSFSFGVLHLQRDIPCGKRLHPGFGPAALSSGQAGQSPKPGMRGPDGPCPPPLRPWQRLNPSVFH